MKELSQIKQLLDEYKENILNVRIGATDFSGIYGIRRSADTTVYDIAILRDCICDIINIFQRADSPYVISGPVWEYFSSKERILKPQLRQTPFRRHFGDEGLKWRTEINIDQNMDGLIREILLDIANGLTGKTIIHPSHIKIVQALNIVSFEEYVDAVHVIESATGEYGVRKSYFANKMNEIKPHFYWAQRVLLKSQLYGVLNEEYTNIDLIKKEVLVQSLDCIQVKVEVTDNPFDLSLDQLFTMAARINKKRSFLFVSLEYGKHIPINPKKGLLTSAILAARYHESVKGGSGELTGELLAAFNRKKPPLSKCSDCPGGY